MAAVRLCCCVFLLSLVGIAVGNLRGPPGSVCTFVGTRQVSWQVDNRRRRESSPGVWDYLKEVLGTKPRYRRGLITVYGTEYFTGYECCLGWNRIEDTCQADCYFPCGNGLCVDTNVCECDEGWEGQFCHQDIDECWLMIDECDRVNGGCINTQGSYNCTCNGDLHLINGTFCHATPDTDECANGNGGCDQNCHNTHGSFRCSCDAGYNLGTDGLSCIDINECSSNAGGCDHFCTNTDGGRNCSCRSGFRLAGETTCRDDDLYPYGHEVDGQPRRWEFSECHREELPQEGFRFFGRRHHNVYICDNGIVGFDPIVRPRFQTPIQNVPAFSAVAVLAPFLAKSNATDYKAVWALVVTWTRVPPDCTMYANGACPRPHDQLPVNTFQLVISTNGILSFTTFVYPTLAQQWVSPDEAKAGGGGIDDKPFGFVAVGGYSAGDGRFYPFSPATNSSLVHSGVEFSGKDNRIRHPALGFPVSMRNLFRAKGKWQFALQNEDENDNDVPQLEVAKCSQWLRSQKVEDPSQLFGYSALPSVGTCPCTAEQAWYDSTYRRTSAITRGPSCVSSQRRVHAFVDSERFTMWRRCCYERAYWWSQLRTTSVSSSVPVSCWWGRCTRQRLGGGARRSGLQGGHLIINDQSADEDAFQSCCVEAAKVRGDWYCERFQQHRPLSSPPNRGCRSYAINIPWVRYDPHLTTMDGNKYSFNGLGDFMLADVDNGEYQLQCRMSVAPGSNHATMITAVIAYQRDKHPVQIQVLGNSSLELYVNGSLTDLSVFEEEVDEEEGYELEVGDNALVTQPANNSLLVVFFSGITVKATAKTGMLAVEFSSPSEFKGKIRGLLGKFDGDQSNDFETSNGTVLSVNSTERELYEDFGLTWQLTSEDGPRKSLFPSNTRDSFMTRSSFYPHFTDEITFSDPDLEAQARATCGNNTDCLFDVSQTGDLDLGKELVKDEEEFDNSQDVLNMFPPTLNGPDSVYATVGETVTVDVTATDSTTTSPTFLLGPEVPDTVQLSVMESKATLVWQVTSDLPFKFQLEVYNAENTSAQYWPVVFMCSCQNGGNCDASDDPDPSVAGGENKFYRQTCTCATGYHGERCEMQVDACVVNLHPCFPGSNCTDLPPPAGHGADGYICGPCPDGYTGDGYNCQDRDECAGAEGDVCQHDCRNFLGGFDCVCNDGYSLADDMVSCNDVDECSANLNNCSQLCENTDGGFNCSCRDGFELATDGESCEPTANSSCSDANNPGCDPELGWCLVNGNGTAVCSCRSGYKLGTDGVTCEDVDECLSGTHHCEQLCNNTAGGYNCYCRDGYYTVEDYVTICLEIDECAEGFDDCSVHEQCENEPGSFHCECKEENVEVNGVCLPGAEVDTTATTTPATTSSRPTTDRLLTSGSTSEIPKPVSTAKVSQTDKPTSPFTAKPTVENVIEVNTIVIEILSTVQELIDLVDEFKRALAAALTDFCSQQAETVPACRVEEGDRWRRSYSPAVFRPEDVHVTEGYPKPASDLTRTTLAFFVSHSDTGDFRPVPLDTVETVFQQSQPQLEAALGGRSFAYMGSLSEYLKSGQGDTDDTVLYVIIGVSVTLGVGVIFAVTAYLWAKKKRQKSKVNTNQHLAVPLPVTMETTSKEGLGADNPVMDTKF
ncbi:MUC4 [Branchiostoma lanceolatum]|uniref:MUC4 protein n=1 Tax=Branchiostoma lanceolatum TaxID=7740 RepID=A0A8K0A5J4_BRALA|nr:MUC4 [Branchiostoma lanceolatum]